MLPVLYSFALPEAGIDVRVLWWALAASGAVLGAVMILVGHRRVAALGVVAACGAVYFAKRATGQVASLPPAVELTAFGCMLVVGAALCATTTARAASRAGIEPSESRSRWLVSSVAGLLGARALYGATDHAGLAALLPAVGAPGGGLSLYGALIAGALCAVAMAGVEARRWLDAASPGIALMVGLGRLGCYGTGCDHGVRMSPGAPPWFGRLGMFPRWGAPGQLEVHGAPAWLEQVRAGDIPFGSAHSLPVHPTQLYEALMAAVIGALLLGFAREKRRDGQVFALLLLAYGGGRFCLEFLRADADRGLLGPATHPGAIALAGAMLLAVGWSLGPLRRLDPRETPTVVLAFAGVVSVGVLVLWARSGAGVTPVRVSAPQVAAVLTTLVAGIAWRRSAVSIDAVS